MPFVLVSSRTALFFTVAGRETCPNPSVIWYRLMSLVRGRSKGDPLVWEKVWQAERSSIVLLTVQTISLSYTFVINIVTATVLFQISLLFPVNYYFNSWFSPPVPPVLNTTMEKGWGSDQTVSGLGESRWGHWILL